MAQFYGSIQGNRGEATRMGTKNSGIDGHIRGWSIGARVTMRHINGEDVCSIELTGGSNGYGSSKHLGNFKESDLKC